LNKYLLLRTAHDRLGTVTRDLGLFVIDQLSVLVHIYLHFQLDQVSFDFFLPCSFLFQENNKLGYQLLLLLQDQIFLEKRMRVDLFFCL
jgi:hypothetical protein